MSIVINLVFAGLIVFVPNNYTHPSWVTAYLLQDSQHIRRLTLYGTVSPNQIFQSAYFGCNKTAISDGKFFKVECDLPQKTDISIEATVVASGNSFLPPVPHEEVPTSLEEAKEKDWFLHMSNIDNGIRGVDVSKAEAAAGAEISFPSDDAEACELDGEEEHKYESIGFKSDVLVSEFKQAVAESVLFHFSVKPGRLRVVLSSQKNVDQREVEAINVDCFGQNCLSVGVDNSMPNCVENENPGAHFEKYYSIVNHAAGTEKIKPFRVAGEGHCPAPHAEREKTLLSLSLLDCDLKLLAPVSPQLANLGRDFIRESLSRGERTQVELGSFLSRLRTELGPAERDLFASVFAREVMNRVICPPVVVSP
jgi:hypothetical protein